MGASPFVFFRLKKVAPSGCGRGSGACMCPNLNISFAAVLTMSACVALPSPADAAVQRFTDEVGVELTTPIGKTQGTFKVTELKIGSGSPVRREGIGKHQTISTTAPTSCPEGMVGVAAETGGFCIEIDRSYSGDVRKAEKACAMAGKRLCQAIEWQHACEEAKSNGLGLKNITGEWEWTGSYAKYDVQVQTGERGLSDELKSVLLGKSDCQTQYLYPSWRSGPYPGRCCK